MAFDPTKYGALKVTSPTTTNRFVPQKQTQPKESLAEKVAGFAGVKNISKAIAYAISPTVRQYEKESIGKLPTAKELAGDVLQVGATVGTGGLGGKVLGTGVKATLGLAGASGATFGFGQGLSEDKSIPDSVKQAVASGLISVATVGALYGASKLAKPTQKLIGKGVETTKKAFSAGKAIKKIEGKLVQQPYERLAINNQIRDIQRQKKVISETVQGLKATKQQAIFEGSQKITGEAQKQTVAIKQKLMPVFKEMTKTYGIGLENAEKELVKNGAQITTDDAANIFRETINSIKENAIPEDSNAFRIISDSLKSFTNKKNAGKTISLSELKNIKNKIYGTLSGAVKTGNKYASVDDKVATTFLQNYGKFIGEMSPELKILNQEFATMANARNWAMRTFKPYNVNEIDKGTKVLSTLAEQVSKGKTLNQNALRYLKILEEGSGQFKGAGKLTGKTLDLGLVKYKLVDSIDVQLKSLANKVSKLNENVYKLQTNKAGISATRTSLLQQLKELERLRSLRNKIITIGVGAIALPKVLKTAINLGGI